MKNPISIKDIILIPLTFIAIWAVVVAYGLLWWAFFSSVTGYNQW